MRYELKETRHGLLLFDADDTFVGRALRDLGEYSWAELEMVRQLLPADGVVVEAGAHIGTLTVQMARMCAQVFAFEPQRLIFQMLCANLALNGLLNVRAFEQALAAEDGTGFVPKSSPTNTGGVSLIGLEEGDPVVQRSIDSLALPRIDLLKADVEGMELDIVRGARQTIARLRPTLYLESNIEHDALIAELDSLGYDAYWHFPEMLTEPRPGGQTFVVSLNLLCLPRERATRVTGLTRARAGDRALAVANAELMAKKAAA